MARSIVSLWHGVYLVERGEVIDRLATPSDATALAGRLHDRAAGLLTPEETEMLGRRKDERWTTRDRRLVSDGVTLDPSAAGDIAAPADLAVHRTALLAGADRAIAESWDPSVHVEEAVRSLRDIDRALNLLGERVAGWVSHDAPGVDPEDPDAAAKALLGERAPSRFGPTEPTVTEARRRLASVYLELRATRAAVEDAVRAAAPTRTPNLAELLGPDLASRLVAQAGGLDRLARMPASTVQVLGAEKAFFEHLRGRAPPPRHGLLFLHPSIQTAPRPERGRLARSLAAKAAIAARLDRASRPVDPTLKAAFERRREEIRRHPPKLRPRTGRRSRPPLDRTAEHR